MANLGYGDDVYSEPDYLPENSVSPAQGPKLSMIIPAAIILILIGILIGYAYLYFSTPVVNCGSGTFDSKTNSCIFLPKVSLEALCPQGSTLDSERSICLSAAEPDYSCTSGTFDELTNKCVLQVTGNPTYTCSSGTLNAQTNKCEVSAVLETVCDKGTLNEAKTKCIYVPEVETVCNVGTYNSQTNKCEITPDTQYVCPSGVLDEVALKCQIIPDTQYNCASGTYSSTSGKCEVTPQIDYICFQSTYNSQTGFCESTPQTQYTCALGILKYIDGVAKCVVDMNTQTNQCGDNTCNAFEKFTGSCPNDCTGEEYCGDGTCSSTESQYNICPKDCTTTPTIKTCAAQNGFSCTTNQTCSATLLTASDSNKCCSVACTTTPTQTGLKILPPTSGVYLGAYDWQENKTKPGVKEFEDAIGKKVAIFGSGGKCTSPEDQTFDINVDCLNELYTKGYITEIDISPRLTNTILTAQDILDGKADSILTAVANKILAFNKPIFLGYQREPNAQGPLSSGTGDHVIVSWGYGVNGDKKVDEVTDKYGLYTSLTGDSCNTPNDLKCDDGRERYRDMTRYIHNKIESIAPNRVTWVMGAIIDHKAGAYASWYPGDAYVDWLSLDVYPGIFGGVFENTIEPDWSDGLKLAPNKPFMFTEFGVQSNIPYLNRVTWLNNFFNKVRTTHPQLKAFIYWQKGTDAHDAVDSRIRVGDSAAQAWKNDIAANPNFWLSSITTGGQTPTSQTCSQQSGFTCTTSQTCSGTTLTASDTSNCCSITCTSTPTQTGLKILPPTTGIYLGAYDYFENGTNPGIKEFETAIGKKVAIGKPKYIKFGGAEGTTPAFDLSGALTAYNEGYTQVFGIEYMVNSTTHTPQSIINGSLDTAIRNVAKDIKTFGKPIFWIYQREPEIQPGNGFDGGGYGPNGTQLRTETDDPYKYFGCTDSSNFLCLDGPERYRAAAIHIHDLVESECKDCVTWVAGADVGWNINDYKKYYPGDNYVDWHAFDRYVGDEQNLSPYQSFGDNAIWKEALSISNKPIIILEFGIFKYKNKTQLNDRSTWFQSFFNDVRTNPKMSNLKAFLYWQQGADSPDSSNTRIRATDPEAAIWKTEIQNNPNFWLSSITTGGTITTNNSDPITPTSNTCSDLSGFICTESQTCSGTLLSATDSSSCCSVACTTPTVTNNTCAGKGGYKCTEGQTCSGSLIDSSDSEKCCSVTCTTSGGEGTETGLTCAQKGFRICAVGQTCSTGEWALASDTSRCCRGTCS
jgi:beta-mannanase